VYEEREKKMKKKRFIWIVMAFVLVFALASCSSEDQGGKASTGMGTTNGLAMSPVTGTGPEADTPADQLDGLTIGDAIWTNGMKITLNSVEEGPEASDKSPTYLISVTYENFGQTMNSVSPFDWYTLEADDTTVGYDMKGKGSFNLVTLPENQQFTGDVIIFKTDSSKGVVFDATLKWSDIAASWLLP
jgi:hypothetical protein